MLLGVIYGIAACMIWGFAYIAPLILSNYDPLHIALVRYVIFGCLSLGLAVTQWKEFSHYSAADWKRALALGIIGNLFYFWLLAEACQLAGAPVAGAFTAMIPITVALIGNLRAVQRGEKALAWRSLLPPLALVLIGMVCLNGTEFVYLVESGRQTQSNFWLGVLAAIVSLAVWTWYPICHGEWLMEHPQRSPQAWSTAQGVTLLPASFFGLIGYILSGNSAGDIFGPTPLLFLAIAFFLGIVTSWVGIWLWSLMSRRLPTALGGQMIVFETLFAVIYTHLWRSECPTPLMLIGMAFLLIGIVGALRAFNTPR